MVYLIPQRNCLQQTHLESMNKFQNCLDYFQGQNLQQLITNILPRQKTVTRKNIDHDRTAYSLLLKHTISQLQRFKHQGQKSKTIKCPSSIDKELISPVFNEVLQLLNRECHQKSELMQIIFSFFQQSLIIMDLSAQDKIKKILIQYFRNIESQRKQSEQEINALKSELFSLRQENQKKWKTFYMIVKDNRVLRRQKGKLMRELQQLKSKLCTIHEQMMQIAKENQKYKLLANYQQSPEAIESFLKNSLAINKLEGFMKKYPKNSKKILKNDLKNLEISQHFNLDEKIMYILKTAKESQQILDEYEDLADISERPNKLIFNISTQTDLFDIGIDPPNQKPLQVKTLKKLIRNFHTQTHPQHLFINSNVIEVSQVIKKVQSHITRRRIALKTNAVEDLKIIEAVRHFTQNGLSRKVYNIKILNKKQNVKAQMRLYLIYSLLINNQRQSYAFPPLPTTHQLDLDIRRTKQMSRKDIQRRRSSRKENIHRSSVGCVSVDLQEEDEEVHKILQQSIKYNQVNHTENEQSTIELNTGKMIGQKSSQKYKINPPQNKKSKAAKQERSINNRSTNKKAFGDSKNIQASISHSNQRWRKKKQINRSTIREGSITKESIMDRQKTNRDSTKEIQSIFFKQKSNIELKNPLQTLHENLSSQPQFKKTIRKSAFAAYKRINTLPNKALAEEHQFQEDNRSINRKQKETQANPSQIIININNTSKRYNNPKDKIINIFSVQSSRLIHKIAKNIFVRRKQISKTNETLEVFLNSFFKAQFGTERKITISNTFKQNQTDIDPLYLTVLDILLDHTLPIHYLSHLFKVFGKILMINSSEHLMVSPSKKKYIQKQIFTLHFSEDKSNKLMLKSSEQDQQSNICHILLDLDYQLRRQLKGLQTGSFLSKLLPSSQKYLNFEEINQIFQLFIHEKKYCHYLLALKKCCNPHISVQNICLFAIREEWEPLIHIEDYILSRWVEYQQIIGQQWRQMHIDERFTWTRQIIGLKNHNKNNETSILQKYLKVLQANHLLDKHTPISYLLTTIQNALHSHEAKNSLASTLY